MASADPLEGSVSPRVDRVMAVVGGGITGLVAARYLALEGAEVTLFEASQRLGGQVRTVEVLGHQIDVGAESLHLAGPAITDLLDDLDLTAELVTASSSFVWIWDGRRRRVLPAGVGPAGPTRLAPLVKARVLSPLGMARAALEPLVPRRTPWVGRSPEVAARAGTGAGAGRVDADVAVGPFIAARFGRQVTDRLVDPVLGSLHAGDVNRLSLRAATPQLAARAERHRSLLAAPSGGPRRPPSFVSFPRGLSTLVDTVLRGTEVDVNLGAPVRQITTTPAGFDLDGDDGLLGSFDGVVVALPAGPASRVLGQISEPAAGVLAELRAASVATVVAAYPRAEASRCEALSATGLLTPSGTGALMEAATFLTTKWPQLQDDDHFLVRLSAGRAGEDRLADMDDSDLADRLLCDLARATGLEASATLTEVNRWPSSLPQLEVGHLGRLAAINRQLDDHPGLVLAGAAYEGLGIATCVRSGRAAARQVFTQLGHTQQVPT